MKAIRIKIITVFILVSFVGGFMPVRQAQAVIPVVDKFKILIDKIVDALSLSNQTVANLSLGLPGTGAATRAALKGGKTACTTYDKAIKIADTADTIGSAAVIAGSGARLAQLSTKIAALTGLRTCYQLMLEAIEKGGTVVGVTGNQALEQLSGEDFILTSNINSLDQRIDRLKEQKHQATVELWKGVAVRTLMRVQLRITTNMVNQLVAKYKISNILKYADAAATQVYMIDYINKNVPDGKDQAILRSIFANQGLHDTVYPMIRAKIEQQIQKAPGDLMITSGDFYDELNQYGSPDYNAAYVSMTYQNTLDYAKARAAEYALEEIQTSQGFLPVRNCTDIMVFQRQYDQDNARLANEVKFEEENVLKLMSADMNSRVTGAAGVDPNEIKIARAKLNEAQKALQEFGKTQKAFTPPCGPIVNPGYSVAQSINSYLSSQLGSAANLKTENLPFFATFAESVASNFLTKIVTAGIGSVHNLLTGNENYESSAINTTAVVEDKGEANYLKSSDTQAERDNATFSGERTTNTSLNEYILKWNVEALPGASYLIISGPNRFSVRQTVLSGQLAVSANSGGVYTLTAYNSQNQVLDTTTFDMPPRLQGGDVDLSDSKDTATDASNASDQILDDINTGPSIETLEQQNPTLVEPTLIWPNPDDNSPFTYNSGNKTSGLVAGVSVKRPSEPPRGYKIEQLR